MKLKLKRAELHYGDTICPTMNSFNKDLSDKDVFVTIDLDDIKSVELLVERVLKVLKRASGGFTMNPANVIVYPKGRVYISGDGYQVNFQSEDYVSELTTALKSLEEGDEAGMQDAIDRDLKARYEFGFKPIEISNPVRW